MHDILLSIRDLCVDFTVDRRHTVRAINHVSLDIHRGETLGLVGESGCGKTTLGRTVKGLYTPASGSILFDGKDIFAMSAPEKHKFTQLTQMIFQDPYSSLDPRMTIREIIREGMEAHHMGSRKQLDKRVDEMMSLVGLNAEYSERYPHEFSGGQRQRVGIARALALNPSFVVCDEPTSALDVSIQAQVVRLLKELQTQMSLTYLFISHDLAMVKYVADRIAVMYLGEIVEIASSDELYEHPMHPYTEALFSAIQIPDPVAESKRKRIHLEGDVPNPAEVSPIGCRFRTRCPYATPECAHLRHELLELHPGHLCAGCVRNTQKQSVG